MKNFLHLNKKKLIFITILFIAFVTFISIYMAVSLRDEKITDFYLVYEDIFGLELHHDKIIIKSDGTITYQLLEYGSDKINYNEEKKLDVKEFERLVKFIIKDNKFFSIPQELSANMMDQGVQTIEVMFNGKSHICGGEGASKVNDKFGNIEYELIKYKARLFKISD